jgi:hypothetical protein
VVNLNIPLLVLLVVLELLDRVLLVGLGAASLVEAAVVLGL